MKILVLGEKDFCQVFSFMGVETLEVKEKGEIIPILEEKIYKDYLILVSYTFYKELKGEIEEVKLKSPKAVILEVPSLAAKPKEEFDVKKLLQAISGIKI